MPTAFLSLPLELRTQIYEYVLLLPDSKTWISGSALSPTSPTSPTSPKSPTLTFAFPTPYLDGLIPVNLPEFSTGPAALLRACSLINQEASQVLYSRNCFKVKAAQALLEWLEAIGPQNTQHLKALHIIAGARYFKSWPKVLCTLRDQAPGLRHIFISWRHHEQYGEDCIRDALAEIRGLEKLTIDTSVLENCSLRMVKRSQIYLEKAMGMPVSLGPIASEMATAVTSCCCFYSEPTAHSYDDACHLFTEKTEANSGFDPLAQINLGIEFIADVLGFDWFTGAGFKVLKS